MYSVATTARRAGLLAAAASAAGLLTACGASTPAPAPTKTVTRTAAAAGAPAPAATASATTPAPAAVAGPATCLPSALQASVGQGQGAAGTLYQVIVLTNTSNSACTLYGYPGVSFVTGSGGSVIGAPASRNPLIRDTLITLPPGQAASALVGVTDTGALPQSACQPGTSDWLQIYPPGDRGSLFVQYRAQVCTRPGEKYMTVTAMHAGTTSSF
jgi:Protein of unknown function (DUF4232)